MSVTMPKTTGQKFAVIAIGLVLFLILAAILFPVFAQPKVAATVR